MLIMVSHTPRTCWMLLCILECVCVSVCVCVCVNERERERERARESFFHFLSQRKFCLTQLILLGLRKMGKQIIPAGIKFSLAM
jgi:hypothetical protein